jgi:hypothetical protein
VSYSHHGADGAVHSGPGGLFGCRECDRDRAEEEAAGMPDSDGIDAIIQAYTAIADGRAELPDGDLITQAMWHLATEGVQPRLERLALAGALIAIEINRMEMLRDARP